MRFISVYDDLKTAIPLLYRLLAERQPHVNISHRTMPTFDEHRIFVNSRPYAYWYIFGPEGAPIGAIYLTHAHEIGVFVLRRHRRQGHGAEAVRWLIDQHPGWRFLANVNPANKWSAEMFINLGFRPIQTTYELRP